MKYILIMLLAFAFMTGSHQTTENKANKDDAAIKTSKNLAQGDGEFFGEKFNTSKAQSVDDMVKRLHKKGSHEATVKGEVRDVCKKKGCWMKLVQKDGEDIMVTFKDYGFFVPKDISGETIIMHGIASLDTTDVATLRHYAEDAGKSQEEIEKITEPEVQIAFKADGVYLERKEQ